VRRSEKFLRSFGKQWEAILLTFLLMINNLDQKWEEEKNSAQFVVTKALIVSQTKKVSELG
jgi:hypothetical protein